MRREKDKLIVKPNRLNAFLPKFTEAFFRNLPYFIVAFLVYVVIDVFYPLGYPRVWVLSGLFAISIIIAFLVIIKAVFMYTITQYIFHVHSIEKKINFFVEQSHSISYQHITDVHIKKTFWDNLTNVGDIIIYSSNDTGEDGNNSLILKDIKNPDKIKDEIQKIVFHMN